MLFADETDRWIAFGSMVVTVVGGGLLSLLTLWVKGKSDTKMLKVEADNEELGRANKKLVIDHQRCEENIVSLRGEMHEAIAAVERRLQDTSDVAERHRRRAHDVNNLTTPLLFRLIQAGVPAEEVERMRAVFVEAMKRNHSSEEEH